MLPYMGFVVYSSFRFPQGHWPSWVGNTLLVWFASNFVILFLVARKLFKRHASAPQPAPVAETKMTARVWGLRAFISYLLIVWTVLFCIGVKGTITGKYALNRAIPAGVFLLFFIGIFGWSLYRSFQRN